MKYERRTDPRFVPATILMCSGKCVALEIYLRLAELEDKIESGELVPAAEDKNARHRAEVAERALSWLCDETMRDIRIIMYPTIGKRVRDKQELYDYCIEQAEREIEKKEERKE